MTVRHKVVRCKISEGRQLWAMPVSKPWKPAVEEREDHWCPVCDVV